MQIIIFSALVIMLASLVGVVFAWKGFNHFLGKNRKYLVTFAIGVFVVVTYSLVKETFHLTESFSLAIGSILSGALLLYLASLFMPHHHHDTDGCCPDRHNPLDARRILLGDAIHNVGDGILLVSAFFIDIRVGLIAAFGILLHELVQEIAEFFILKEAGYTTRKALIYNFLVSSTIFLGIVIGLFASFIPVVNVIFIGLASGGFLYILAADLVPHTIHSIKNSGNMKTHVFIGTLGVLAMLSVGLLVPHTHEHDDHHHDGEMADDKSYDEHHEYIKSHEKKLEVHLESVSEEHSSHTH